ncbi:hypothetical protein L208DRAFT_457380 [Tricholoma matsutake]|nr:hypothetical protein L208DRAFT_457380 [Tricholoma matsutake 945]
MGIIKNITKPTGFIDLLRRLTGSRSASTQGNIVNQRTPFIVADVLLNIMCLCDIAAVISMSQVSKHFHALAFSRQNVFQNSHLTHLSIWRRLQSEDLVRGRHTLVDVISVSLAPYPYILIFSYMGYILPLCCSQGVDSCCLQTRKGYVAGMSLMTDWSGNTEPEVIITQFVTLTPT